MAESQSAPLGNDDKPAASSKPVPAKTFTSTSTALEVVEGHDLTGKYAIVTGASSGIGIETARALALAGCHVVMAVRDLPKAVPLVEAFKKEKSSVSVETMYVDLQKLVTVKQFAKEYLDKGYPLHFLVLNAGMYTASPFSTTADGFETTFQTNHLAHFYLTNLLTDKLVASAPSRIVVVSSDAHLRSSINSEAKLTREYLSPATAPFFSYGVYGMTKFCNVLHTMRLHELLHSKGVSVFSLHPGVIATGFTRNNAVIRFVIWTMSAFTKSIEQGAATSVYCCVAPGLEAESGKHFRNCAVADVNSAAKIPNMPLKLWELCEGMISEASAKFPTS